MDTGLSQRHQVTRASADAAVRTIRMRLSARGRVHQGNTLPEVVGFLES
jgi:hypothetical protein